jgi:nucleotide-binding universal stress UspA family protein
MNGTIVCAVNDSESAHAAARVAVDLGERFGARVVLVSVAQGLVRPGGSNALTAGQTRADARRLLERAVGNDPAGRVEHRVEVGEPADALAEIAAEEAAALIVVGARPGVLRKTVRSSFARELASLAPCPVMVVPADSAATVPPRVNVVAAPRR